MSSNSNSPSTPVSAPPAVLTATPSTPPLAPPTTPSTPKSAPPAVFTATPSTPTSALPVPATSVTSYLPIPATPLAPPPSPATPSAPYLNRVGCAPETEVTGASAPVAEAQPDPMASEVTGALAPVAEAQPTPVAPCPAPSAGTPPPSPEETMTLLAQATKTLTTLLEKLPGHTMSEAKQNRLLVLWTRLWVLPTVQAYGALWAQLKSLQQDGHLPGTLPELSSIVLQTMHEKGVIRRASPTDSHASAHGVVPDTRQEAHQRLRKVLKELGLSLEVWDSLHGQTGRRDEAKLVYEQWKEDVENQTARLSELKAQKDFPTDLRDALVAQLTDSQEALARAKEELTRAQKAFRRASEAWVQNVARASLTGPHLLAPEVSDEELVPMTKRLAELFNWPSEFAAIHHSWLLDCLKDLHTRLLALQAEYLAEDPTRLDRIAGNWAFACLLGDKDLFQRGSGTLATLYKAWLREWFGLKNEDLTRHPQVLEFQTKEAVGPFTSVCQKFLPIINALLVDPWLTRAQKALGATKCDLVIFGSGQGWVCRLRTVFAGDALKGELPDVSAVMLSPEEHAQMELVYHGDSTQPSSVVPVQFVPTLPQAGHVLFSLDPTKKGTAYGLPEGWTPALTAGLNLSPCRDGHLLELAAYLNQAGRAQVRVATPAMYPAIAESDSKSSHGAGAGASDDA